MVMVSGQELRMEEKVSGRSQLVLLVSEEMQSVPKNSWRGLRLVLDVVREVREEVLVV